MNIEASAEYEHGCANTATPAGMPWNAFQGEGGGGEAWAADLVPVQATGTFDVQIMSDIKLDITITFRVLCVE